MVSPSKLAHIVLRTPNVKALCEWYCSVLNARVVFEQLPEVAFITFDDEHHRMGFARTAEAVSERSAASPGLSHSAWTFRNIRELLGEYSRLKHQGILPNIRINHGMTVSLYYTDPDGNNVELQVDRLSAVQADEFMRGPVFRKNPVGVEIDPDALIEKMKTGASDEDLLFYDTNRVIDVPAMMKRFNEAREADLREHIKKRHAGA